MLPPVNCFRKIIINGIHRVSSDNLPIQINHYVNKSYHEFISKKSKKGDAVYANYHKDLKYFLVHDKQCQNIDLHAFKYIIPLKLSMSGQSVILHNRLGG